MGTVLSFPFPLTVSEDTAVVSNLVAFSFDGIQVKRAESVVVANDRQGRGSGQLAIEKRALDFTGYIQFGDARRIPVSGKTEGAIRLQSKQFKVGQQKVLHALPTRSRSGKDLFVMVEIKTPQTGTVDHSSWAKSKGEAKLLASDGEEARVFLFNLHDGAVVRFERRGALETPTSGALLLARVGESVFFNTEARMQLIPAMQDRFGLRPKADRRALVS